MFDYVWVCVTMYEYEFAYMDMYRNVWVCMGMYGYYGYVWLCMGMNGNVWVWIFIGMYM